VRSKIECHSGEPVVRVEDHVAICLWYLRAQIGDAELDLITEGGHRDRDLLRPVPESVGDEVANDLAHPGRVGGSHDGGVRPILDAAALIRCPAFEHLGDLTGETHPDQSDLERVGLDTGTRQQILHDIGEIVPFADDRLHHVSSFG